jgi:hypothetical protein
VHDLRHLTNRQPLTANRFYSIRFRLSSGLRSISLL